MTTQARGIAAILTLVAFALPAGAQTAADPAGHWEGAVTAPFGEIRIEVDLARNAKGEWDGAFSQPAQGMRGLPLSSVTVEGATVRFLVGAGAGASTFTGTVADGKTIAGDATSPLGTAPFKLTRTGDAVIEAPPRGALVSKSLEGNWEGTLDVGGQRSAARAQDRQSARWHFRRPPSLAWIRARLSFRRWSRRRTAPWRGR